MPDLTSAGRTPGRMLSHGPRRPVNGARSLPAGSGAGGRLKILLADEQTVVREGVALLLAENDHVDIVGSTADGGECVRLGFREQPDLVIFDSAMRGLNGIDAARRIVRRRPETRMLCLSSRDDPSSVRAAFDAGVHGYVAKRNAFSVLSEAIDRIFRCGCYISPDMAHVLVDGFRSRHGGALAGTTALSSREREVTQLYAEGHSTRDIADRLHLSMKTVGTHRDHVMSKLGVRGIAHLTRYAIREGLVSTDV